MSEQQEPPTESPRIYPLVGDSGNERVLNEWLTAHDTYRLADEDEPVTAGEFDLCIVDRAGLEASADELRTLKADAKPVLVPVLLLLPETREEVIEADRGDVADNVFRTAIDEIVSLPIRQIELDWRIGALLRLRTQSLELLSKTEDLRRFKRAAEAAGHAIFITGPERTIEYVNPAFEDITGYEEAEILGETPAVLRSGEMSQKYYERLHETIAAGDIWEGEITDRRKDGTQYTAYQTIAPITDDDGENMAYVAVQTDVTERKELRDRLKRHRDIVHRLEDPIMLQDEAGNFELVNEALTEFAGLPEEELLGTDEFLFMDPDAAERIRQNKRETIETESAIAYSITPEFERSDKEAIFDTRRYPYYDDDGELTGTIAICRDVTDLEERTRQLRVIDTILRHNLRNDLTLIRGLAEQIRSQTSGETAVAADTIISYADELMTTGEKSRVITNLLSDKPETKQIDITELARSIADSIDAADLTAELTVAAPERVVASATANIETAIGELVDNAIIHNDREVPSVELRVTTDGDTARIHVIDDGPGLSEMDRDVLTTGRATDALYHGSGLGLWLVYWAVKRSIGSIDVTEVEPRGTKVTVILPRPSV